MNFLNDRFTKGFVAGFIGGMATSVVNLPFYLLGVVQVRLLDFPGVLIYGHIPETFWETMFIFLVHCGFAGFGGALFVHLVTLVTEDNFLFKGYLFGIGIWFLVYITAELFKIPQFRIIHFPTALGNFIASSAYGIVLTLVFKYLDRKYKGRAL